MKKQNMFRILGFVALLLSIMSSLFGEKYIGLCGPATQSFSGSRVNMGANCIVHWAAGNTSWYLNSIGAGDGLTFSQTQSAVQNAFNEWENVTTATITFDYGNSTSNEWDNDNMNVHFWAESGDPVYSYVPGFGPGVLAVTIITINSSEELTDADIVFNGRDYVWKVDGNNYDIQAVSAHEIGHMFGLHHSDVAGPPKPTMRQGYTIDWGTVEFDDKVGVSFLYVGNLIDDETISGTDYYRWDLNLYSGKTLTVQPGSTLKFYNGKRLTINGTLSSQGTSVSPITFTTENTTPSQGDWKGVIVNGSANATINYANIQYAKTNLELIDNSNSISISNSTFTNALWEGIKLMNSEPTINNCTITDNGYYGIMAYNSYSPSWNSVDFLGNTIRDNGYYGMAIQNSSPTMEDNEISSNGIYGIYGISGSKPVLSENQVFSNSSHGTKWYSSSSPYLYHKISYDIGGCNNIYNNGGDGIYAGNSSYPNLGSSSAYPGDNNIYGNSGYEVSNHSSGLIYARYNWWGSGGPSPSDFYGPVF